MTPAILDRLDRRGARATFFASAASVAAYLDLAAEMHRRGHRVENHTFGHPLTPSGSTAPARWSGGIRAAQDAIAAATGRAPRLFRAPVGIRNPGPTACWRAWTCGSSPGRGAVSIPFARTRGGWLARLLRGLAPATSSSCTSGSSARDAEGRAVAIAPRPRAGRPGGGGAAVGAHRRRGLTLRKLQGLPSAAALLRRAGGSAAGGRGPAHDPARGGRGGGRPRRLPARPRRSRRGLAGSAASCSAARKAGLEADVLAVDAHLAYYYKRVIRSACGRTSSCPRAPRLPPRVRGGHLPRRAGRDHTRAGASRRRGRPLRSRALPRQSPAHAARSRAREACPLERSAVRARLPGVWGFLRGYAAGEPRPPLWLAYGESDRYAYGHRLLASALPKDRVLVAPGGDWKAWDGLWREFLAGARSWDDRQRTVDHRDGGYNPRVSRLARGLRRARCAFSYYLRVCVEGGAPSSRISRDGAPVPAPTFLQLPRHQLSATCAARCAGSGDYRRLSHEQKGGRGHRRRGGARAHPRADRPGARRLALDDERHSRTRCGAAPSRS